MSTLTPLPPHAVQPVSPGEEPGPHHPRKPADPKAKEDFDHAMHPAKAGKAVKPECAGEHSHKPPPRHAKLRRHQDEHDAAAALASAGHAAHPPHTVPPEHRMEQVHASQADSNDTTLRERLASAVAEMLSSHPASPDMQVHMVFRQDYLPGVSVHVHRDGIQIVVVFECGDGLSRNRLDRGMADIAETMARRLRRDVAVSIKSTSTGSIVARAFGTSATAEVQAA